MAETLHEMAVRMVGDRCTLGCAGCPAKALWDKNDICLIGQIVNTDNCEEQIEGLRAWAKEHPEPRYPTWSEWQNSMFPDADGEMNPCEFGNRDRFNCEGKTCDECTQQQIPADIAAKLGIRPIEEAKDDG